MHTIGLLERSKEDRSSNAAAEGTAAHELSEHKLREFLKIKTAKLLKKPLTYVFNPVQESMMGFRPGTQSEKESIYHQPLIDALLEIREKPSQCIYNEETPIRRKASIDNGVWCYPKSPLFLRGTNLKDMTIIIDECQNFTVAELRKILTRVHDSCKVICIGHSGQIDIPAESSGFGKYMNHFYNNTHKALPNTVVSLRNLYGQPRIKVMRVLVRPSPRSNSKRP